MVTISWVVVAALVAWAVTATFLAGQFFLKERRTKRSERQAFEWTLKVVAADAVDEIKRNVGALDPSYLDSLKISFLATFGSPHLISIDIKYEGVATEANMRDIVGATLTEFTRDYDCELSYRFDVTLAKLKTRTDSQGDQSEKRKDAHVDHVV